MNSENMYFWALHLSKSLCLHLYQLIVYNFQWITMFDDSASKIIGKTALEMATIKEESEINYRKVLNSAKYRQFNFLVKTSMESWNDEQRLKMSVANAELVNYKDEKHVKRLKAEIEALKTEN